MKAVVLIGYRFFDSKKLLKTFKKVLTNIEIYSIIYTEIKKQSRKAERGIIMTGFDGMNLDQFIERMVEMATISYIKTYGEEKWNSLTDEQKKIVQHKIVMDFANMVNTAE